MEFEYDEPKSRSNREKHGIDFIEAQSLWKDDDAIVVPANVVGKETRFALISRYKEKCYTAIYTMRGDTCRIISVRRCRKNEEYHYENHLG